jgi:hypothetical protein
MSFGDEMCPPVARLPRFIAQSKDAFALQDEAARAAGLDWHAWACRQLVSASLRDVELATLPPERATSER